MPSAQPYPDPDRELTTTTSRLRLTPMVAADVDELFGVLADVRLHRFTGGAPLSQDALRAKVAVWQRRISPDGMERWLNWTIRTTSDDTVVGSVQASVAAGCATIAYVIGTAYAGQGIASEASRAMCTLLRERLGVEELVAHIHPQHLASQRVARRAGLVPTGSLDADGEEIWRSAS